MQTQDTGVVSKVQTVVKLGESDTKEVLVRSQRLNQLKDELEALNRERQELALDIQIHEQALVSRIQAIIPDRSGQVFTISPNGEIIFEETNNGESV